MNLTSSETNSMQTSITDARSITATRPYSVPELAEMWATGPRSVYRAIKAGNLRAARINDRGDLRVLGSWALEYLESLAKRSREGNTDNVRL